MIQLAAAGAIALAALQLPADAPPAVSQPARSAAEAPRVVLQPEGEPGQANPTGRAIVLTTPVMQGESYLGDATLTLAADGRASFPADRLLTLLEPQLKREVLAGLRLAAAQAGELGPSALETAGVKLRYNPQALQIELEIAAASRGARSVTVGSGRPAAIGSYVAPAQLSAYLNMRGSVDWVQQGGDPGLAPPVLYLDGAARLRSLVFESEIDLRPGGAGPDLQRRGARFVYDDRARLVRWTAGDLHTLSRGFQSAPEIAGFSASRFYSVLEPQTIVRPRGGRSFQIDRRSVVEVRVNDQLVRRLELDPGAYDLHDFPFAQGANDVRLEITDDVGRRETLDFNIFLDQAQLADGLSEFGVYAGVLAGRGFRGPVYSDTPAISGFYRRGVTDYLTLGGNLQADTAGWMAGGEGVLATPIGAFAGFAAASDLKDVGPGHAAIVSFQRTIQRASGADALSFSLEQISRNFAPLGVGRPFNPYRYTLAASYSGAVTETMSAGVDARFSRGRDGAHDAAGVRGTLGWALASGLNLTSDVGYEHDRRGGQVAVFVSLTYRPGRGSTIGADYDSRYNRTRASYQNYGGAGSGAYAISGDVERSDLGAGATLNSAYYGNRGELGFSHFSTFEKDLGRSTNQRSAIRFGTAIAAADGAVSFGRPVYDAFAVVRAHPSLKGASVLVDPSGGAYAASTGRLGTALQGSLSSYSERSVLVTAPEAPLSANLGEGAYRLLPPYRAGYLLQVGSAYTVSVVGRLRDARGGPLALVTGTATELSHPEREPVSLFTNGDGRFGASGLAPGRWRIVMTDADATTYELNIPAGAEGSLTVGDLSPSSPAPPGP